LIPRSRPNHGSRASVARRTPKLGHKTSTGKEEPLPGGVARGVAPHRACGRGAGGGRWSSSDGPTPPPAGGAPAPSMAGRPAAPDGREAAAHERRVESERRKEEGTTRLSFFLCELRGGPGRAANGQSSSESHAPGSAFTGHPGFEMQQPRRVRNGESAFGAHRRVSEGGRPRRSVCRAGPERMPVGSRRLPEPTSSGRRRLSINEGRGPSFSESGPARRGLAVKVESP